MKFGLFKKFKMSLILQILLIFQYYFFLILGLNKQAVTGNLSINHFKFINFQFLVYFVFQLKLVPAKKLKYILYLKVFHFQMIMAIHCLAYMSNKLYQVLTEVYMQMKIA